MKLAVISVVYNEEILLHHFLDWYSSQADTVFIIDNESTDRSREICKRYRNVVLSTYKTGGVNDVEAANAVLEKARKACIGKYSYVLRADCDEFVISKNGNSIKREIERAGMPEVLGTHGYNMRPKPGEPPYDPKKSLFEQIQWGIENIKFISKPAIIRPESELKFILGGHAIVGNQSLNNQLKDVEKSRFYLLHYSALSEEMFVSRRMSRVRRFSDRSRELGIANHYCDKTEGDFSEKFRTSCSSPSLVKLDIKIPAAGFGGK